MTASRWLMGIATLALAAVAQAHTHLKESVPANGSKVSAAPANIMLTFNEPTRVTALTIQKEGDKEQKLEPLPAEAAAHVMVPAPKLAAGKYTVNWRAVGKDSHVMTGKIVFTVGEAKAASTGHEGH